VKLFKCVLYQLHFGFPQAGNKRQLCEYTHIISVPHLL